MLKSLPTTDEGTYGETNNTIDSLIHNQKQFPISDTMNKLFNGIQYKNLPIINIRVSQNNTILTYTESNGVVKLIRSCGIEGFRNARKGTNVAAQSTAITFGTRTLENGVRSVRVRVRGLGPGRTSAIKGLQMAGLDVVSITDSTPVSWSPPRPRKQRKL
ncbi:unnamed protein product [Ceutorhynchus assimilis]|uniref:Ribosomal protein S11 n=1 Tax=Ceutorhynchus assimilis TaxID=467358 RepID=A0A9N9QQ01_9CUCU|nr:unnamed protein product [Ceutorhynchus assimilis]